MLRRSSPIQRVLVYGTFFSLSLMIHMLLVWPRRGAAERVEAAPVGSQSTTQEPSAAPPPAQGAGALPRAEAPTGGLR